MTSKAWTERTEKIRLNAILLDGSERVERFERLNEIIDAARELRAAVEAGTAPAEVTRIEG